MMKKKIYTKPEIMLIALDSSISLILMTSGPKPPKPHGAAQPSGDPLASPFSDRPFD